MFCSRENSFLLHCISRVILNARKNCPNKEFFLVCIFPYLGWIRIRKSPYSARTRENTDHKKFCIRALFTQCLIYFTSPVIRSSAKFRQDIWIARTTFSCLCWIRPIFNSGLRLWASRNAFRICIESTPPLRFFFLLWAFGRHWRVLWTINCWWEEGLLFNAGSLCERWSKFQRVSSGLIMLVLRWQCRVLCFLEGVGFLSQIVCGIFHSLACSIKKLVTLRLYLEFVFTLTYTLLI